MSFGTVINFCSNDYPFLRHCIDAVKPVCEQIVIPVCDHFFDGKKEDRDVLERIYAENLDVEFVEFPFDKDKSFYGSHSSVHWHNLARMIGQFFLKKEIQYILFLDCDEIVESARFAEWQRTFPYWEYEALLLGCYWYFRESFLQAKTWEDTPLLVKREFIDGPLLMNPWERGGIYEHLQGSKQRKVLGLDAKPLFHHYSWVRTKEQMIRKVTAWSHHRERDWKAQVEEEFSHPFNGIDFVHGYEFIEVSPHVSIDLSKRPKGTDEYDFSRVRKLTHQQVMQIDICSHFQIPTKGLSLGRQEIERNF